MAEFCEVMKQKNRMCNTLGINCPICPIHLFDPTLTCASKMMHQYEKLESIIMECAKENPEPRYPTWLEWQKSTFPDALRPICPQVFMPINPHFKDCCEIDCADCANTPIPADIAEKLGIKPIV